MMNDLVRLELIRESLIAVVNEMRANIIHSSYAAIIYEGHDFSCALMSADGRQVAQGLADHPIHIFAVPYSTREVIAAFKDDIHDGDLFLHNDPYTGGTHLNDVLMLHPVFFEGRLAMFAAIRCHWNDVGGMTPGSLSGRVKEVIQEGIRIPPTRICERGRMNQGVLDLIFNNMRMPEERRGDFNAMLGTGRKAAEHIGRLFRRFGGQAAARRRRGADRALGAPDAGTDRRLPRPRLFRRRLYRERWLEIRIPLVVRLRLTVKGDGIAADFTGNLGADQRPDQLRAGDGIQRGRDDRQGIPRSVHADQSRLVQSDPGDRTGAQLHQCARNRAVRRHGGGEVPD